MSKTKLSSANHIKTLSRFSWRKIGNFRVMSAAWLFKPASSNWITLQMMEKFSGVNWSCFAISAFSSKVIPSAISIAPYISLELYIRVNSTNWSAFKVSKWLRRSLTIRMALLLRIPASFMNEMVSIRARVSYCTDLSESSLSCFTMRQNLESSVSKARPKVSRIYASSFVAVFSLAYSYHWVT